MYHNQKHLTLEDRNYIEQALNQNITFTEMGKYLKKDPTTISKEIKKHRIRKEGNSIHVSFNHCSKRYSCHKNVFVVLIAKENVEPVNSAIRYVLNLMRAYAKDFSMLPLHVMDVKTKLVAD